MKNKEKKIDKRSKKKKKTFNKNSNKRLVGAEVLDFYIIINMPQKTR